MFVPGGALRKDQHKPGIWGLYQHLTLMIKGPEPLPLGSGLSEFGDRNTMELSQRSDFIVFKFTASA